MFVRGCCSVGFPRIGMAKIIVQSTLFFTNYQSFVPINTYNFMKSSYWGGRRGCRLAVVGWRLEVDCDTKRCLRYFSVTEVLEGTVDGGVREPHPASRASQRKKLSWYRGVMVSVLDMSSP